MAVRFVDVIGASGRWRLVLRPFAVLLGTVILLLGVVFAGSFVLVLILVADTGRAALDDPQVAQVLAAGLAGGVVGIPIGLRLVRGRRRVGLFLRKFHYAPAATTITRVLAGRTGRRWRVVTLDDRAVPPVGSGRRWTWVIAAVLGLLALALAISTAAGAGLSGPVQRLNAVVAGALDLTLSGRAVFTGAEAIVIIVVALLVVGVLVTLVGYGSTQRSRWQASATIRGEVDAPRIARRVARRGRRMFGPRLAVVTTDAWQTTVRELGRRCDTIIFDLSMGSGALLWELDNTDATRWVLVCDATAEAALTTAEPGTANARLVELVDGHTVVRYGTDHERFVRSLRRRLDQVARRRRRGRRRVL